GLVLISTIVFWNYALDWLTTKSRRVEKFTFPDPIPIVVNGRSLPVGMRKQFITPAQLASLLREHGIEDVSKVRMAYLEGNGRLSVIPFEEEESAQEDAGEQ